MRRLLASIALTGALALGVAACGGSGSSTAVRHYVRYGMNCVAPVSTPSFEVCGTGTSLTWGGKTYTNR
jgi:hypothetical protein